MSGLWKILTTLALLFLVGCATRAPGTRPQDMSGAAHEAAAEHHDREAGSHSMQSDSDAAEAYHCTAGTGQVCWSPGAGRTEVHQTDSQQHKLVAAQHREASQALRDAEARACAGVPAADRDQSPFSRVADIREVRRLQAIQDDVEGQPTGRGLEGAAVTFRAVPGLTAEWLQRVVDCHLARNAALGFPADAMGYCPLNIKHVRARVHSVGDGFAVEVRSSDAKSVAEIIRRAEGLVQHRQR